MFCTLLISEMNLNGICIVRAYLILIVSLVIESIGICGSGFQKKTCIKGKSYPIADHIHVVF